MCSGSNKSKWSSTRNQCVSASAGSFCDSVSESTCFVGYHPLPILDDGIEMAALIESSEFESAVLKWDKNPTSDNLVVEHVGSEWYSCGLRVGDKVRNINGLQIVGEQMNDGKTYPTESTEACLEGFYQAFVPCVCMIYRNGTGLMVLTLT